MLKKIKKYSYCGQEHEIKRKTYPAFGKTCTNCLKKKLKKKNVERKRNQYGNRFSKKQKQELKKMSKRKRRYTKG